MAADKRILGALVERNVNIRFNVSCLTGGEMHNRHGMQSHQETNSLVLQEEVERIEEKHGTIPASLEPSPGSRTGGVQRRFLGHALGGSSCRINKVG